MLPFKSNRNNGDDGWRAVQQRIDDAVQRRNLSLLLERGVPDRLMTRAREYVQGLLDQANDLRTQAQALSASNQQETTNNEYTTLDPDFTLLRQRDIEQLSVDTARLTMLLNIEQILRVTQEASNTKRGSKLLDKLKGRW